MGNTLQKKPRRWVRSVHPHTCGEYVPCGTISFADAGSSPHMWGIPVRTMQLGVDPRFIPTHVGNTTVTGLSNHTKTVHPHTCGEYCIEHQPRNPYPGSSPHMWGILFQQFQSLAIRRFIPTHVGNTLSLQDGLRLIPVHPHTCGEYQCVHRYDTTIVGSSPHMWGIHVGKRGTNN